MNVDQTRKRLSKGGTHVIRTSDSQEYSVSYPEFVMVGRHNVVIEDQNGLIDIIDPLHVVSIRQIPSAGTANRK